MSGILVAIGTATPAENIPAIDGGVPGAVLWYYAWLILWSGVFSLVIAIRFNWHNSQLGYWLNL
ncbi:MAG: hypothetical protein R3264_21660, partial [Anaerolineae bacterium]|nr:hypothetical protein [Anaerolineae bacterium]